MFVDIASDSGTILRASGICCLDSRTTKILFCSRQVNGLVKKA